MYNYCLSFFEDCELHCIVSCILKPRPAAQCTVLPPGEFNGVILEPLQCSSIVNVLLQQLQPFRVTLQCKQTSQHPEIRNKQISLKTKLHRLLLMARLQLPSLALTENLYSFCCKTFGAFVQQTLDTQTNERTDRHVMRLYYIIRLVTCL